MSPQNILVTGGAGFIGSAFVRIASAAGLRVTIIDALTYAGDRERIAGLTGVMFHPIDITNKKNVERMLAREKFDAIVHFAAETHVDRSILDPTAFIDSNIKGVQILLDAARLNNVKRFIHISTDEVYGEISRGSFRENFPLQPNSPYSASKAAADLLIKSYIRTYGFPAIIVRPSNNYGPWQYPEKLIPVVIMKALRDHKVPVYAKGLNVREWLYVDDCCRGIMLILKKGKAGETYNLGSGCEKTNISLVTTILDALGKPRSLITFVADRKGHDLRYSLNSSKIRALGWKPQVDFTSGIQKTVSWYCNNTAWMTKKYTFLNNYWKKVYR